MINAIIFSYNRAAQLDLLLESIERNAAGVFNLTAAYNYSDADFGRGYEMLKERRGEQAAWVCQRGIFFTPKFKPWVIGLLRATGHSCFFCDDDVIYRPVAKGIEQMITPDVACFSLRLGLNTVYSYMLDKSNPLKHYEVSDEFIGWDWTKHGAENGYPLSTNGHIFRTWELVRLLQAIEFQTLNRMEANLQRKSKALPPTMIAYSQSRLVNIPANRIQDDFPNRYGEAHPRSAESLNAAFLAGQRIDYDALDFSGIDGVNKEIELITRKL